MMGTVIEHPAWSGSRKALRALGMIATSPSWRRFWLAWRHMRYGSAEQ